MHGTTNIKFLGLVVYYGMDDNVIIHSEFTKLFEFHMEENEVGQLSQYSNSLQDEWQMLDSQEEQEFFSSTPHSDLCRDSGYSRSRWLILKVISYLYFLLLTVQNVWSFTCTLPVIFMTQCF